jgi:hypothetical protein
LFLARASAQSARQHELLEVIRATPGDVWLTPDGRWPLAAGKRPVGGWESTDPGALLRDSDALQRWMNRGLAEADGVIVTDLFVTMAAPETARQVLDAARPVLFESPEVRTHFYELAGRQPPPAGER